MYISVVRLNYPESLCFDRLYFYAREGSTFDFESNRFDVQTFTSIINIVISIPFVCSQFSKNLKAKRCYIAIRHKSHFHYYINEIVNISVLCFLLSLFYSLGICVICAGISNFQLENDNFILTYILSIINSTLVLLAFCLVSIPFCVKNDKAAILSDIILFMSCMVASFYIPAKFKCFDIVMVYFVNTLFQDDKYITANSIIGYSTVIIVIISALLLGNKYLAKKDFI